MGSSPQIKKIISTVLTFRLEKNHFSSYCLQYYFYLSWDCKKLQKTSNQNVYFLEGGVSVAKSCFEETENSNLYEKLGKNQGF